MKKIGLLFLALQFWACGNSPKPCTYGSPTAIFSKDTEGVIEHQFSAKGQEAQERVLFSKGIDLEILQGGCNSLSQEFRFRFEGALVEDTDMAWIGQTILMFRYLGSIAEQYLVYHQYAQALTEAAEQMKLGEKFSLGDGFFIMVDRIKGTPSNLIIVEVSQGKE